MYYRLSLVGKSARPLAGRRRGPRPSPDHAWRKASRPDRSTSVAIGRKFCRTAERFHISEAPRAGDSPARESGLRVSAPPREKSPLRRVHRPRLQPNSGSPGRFALPSLSVPDFISSRFSPILPFRISVDRCASVVHLLRFRQPTSSHPATAQPRNGSTDRSQRRTWASEMRSYSPKW